MKDSVEPASNQDEGIQLLWRPRYLNGTISSCAADSSEQAEVERLSNTFCSGSHWTLGKLPTHFEPGSIQTARKTSTMANLLGRNWQKIVAGFRQILILSLIKLRHRNCWRATISSIRTLDCFVVANVDRSHPCSPLLCSHYHSCYEPLSQNVALNQFCLVPNEIAAV